MQNPSARTALAALAAVILLAVAVPVLRAEAASSPSRRAAAPATSAAPAASATSAWWLRPPVHGRLTRGFQAPGAGGFGPGHRGVDFAAPPGTPVRAPVAGTVRFAGAAGGARWVTIEAAPGVLVSVGPLARPRGAPGAAGAPGAHGPDRPIVAGARVGALTPLGVVASADGPRPHPHRGALHLGVRVRGAYVDPLPHLAVPGTPRLVPVAG